MYLPKSDDPAFEDLLEDYLDEVVVGEMALRIEVRLREDRQAREMLLHCLTARSLLGLALGEPGEGSPPGPICAEIRALRRRYASGALDPKQQARLCTHLEACASCESYYDQPPEISGVSWRRFAGIGLAIGALALTSVIDWGSLRSPSDAVVPTTSPPVVGDPEAPVGLAIIPDLGEFWDDLSPRLRTTRRQEGFPGIQEVCAALDAREILDAVVTHPEVESRLDGLVDPDADPWTRQKVAVLVAVLLDEQIPDRDRLPALGAVRQVAGKRGLPFLWHLAGVAQSDAFHRRVITEITRLAGRRVHREALARECERAMRLGWTGSAMCGLRFLQDLGDPRAGAMCKDVLLAPPADATAAVILMAAKTLLSSVGTRPEFADLEELTEAIAHPLGQAAWAASLYATSPQPRWHALAVNHITDPDPRVRRVVVIHLMQREDIADRTLCETLCEDAEKGIRGLAEVLRATLDARSSRPEERKQPPGAR